MADRYQHSWGDLWDGFAEKDSWKDLRDRKYVNINRQLKNGVDCQPSIELPLSAEEEINENDGTDSEPSESI